MNFPSIKTLSECFDEPERARYYLTCSRKRLLEHEAGADYDRRCFLSPDIETLRMVVLNDLGGFHGIESCETESTREYLEYLNTGDMYAPTLILWRDRYRVQDLGTFMERSRVRFK